MDIAVRDKTLELLRAASGEIATAMLRVEQDQISTARNCVEEAEAALMDARHFLSLAA